MVMNEKIVVNKIDKIMKVMDMDGGATLIEALGLLEYCKYLMIERAKQIKNIPTAPMTYEQLKTKRIGDMNV